MPLREMVRTGLVVAGMFYHDPREPVTSVEWWQEPCIAFTAFGSWHIRASQGHGVVTPGGVLASAGEAEHECCHPDGVGDRMMCVLYQDGVDTGPALVVPQAAELHSLRRSLGAQLRLTAPDPAEVDALCLALLSAVREAPGGGARPGARARALAGVLRSEADARYREADLDLVAQARDRGMSRTRFVHVFRDVVGVTPHRYVLELRVGHAARLLRETPMPVTDICFDSGFGSMPSLYAAFRAAYAMTPSAYRAEHAMG
jgi:AraC-like DNA-binding protein